MKQVAAVMIPAFTLSFVLFAPLPAFAYIGPAPEPIQIDVLILLLLVVLSVAGGWQAIEKEIYKDMPYWKKTVRGIAYTLVSLLIIFMSTVSFMYGVPGSVGTAIFGVYSIIRGAKMIRWGKEARPASSVRLTVCGASLIVVSLALIIASFYYEANYYAENSAVRRASQQKHIGN